MESLTWRFPLPRTHAGITLANGLQGVLVWGVRTLSLTIGRNGFWDRRGGNPFSERIDFKTLSSLLGSGGEQRVREIFRNAATDSGRPDAPTQIPCGRIDIEFPEGLRPDVATFSTDTGALSVVLTSPGRAAECMVLRQSLTSELIWIEVPPLLRGRLRISFEPAWTHIGEHLQKVGCQPPTRESLGASIPGEIVVQRLPADPAMALAWADHGTHIAISTALGESVSADPGVAARGVLFTKDLDCHARSAADWWSAYFRDVPKLDIPDASVARSFRHGLMKFAGLTHPSGVAATLQGPWMEEYQICPWSNDYHFNINLQLCYWPALALGRFEHLTPLWSLVHSWFPRLREVGEHFFGTPGAMMLPHATDDTCQAIGTFWQGTVDHASTAWIAQLAFLHYQHANDIKLLRDVAHPLLVGAFEGFWAMLDRNDDAAAGTQLSLPISVSPEFGEGGVGMWGANASFQLAAAHRVARALSLSAAELGLPEDPRWATLRAQLPQASTTEVLLGPWDNPESPKRRRIALWEGQDLTYSHRHHSHLAGIYPFSTLDHGDPAVRPLIEESLKHWSNMGSGQWCAWGLTWAAAICARTDRPDAALAWLHWLIDNCENEGNNLSVSGLLGSMQEWCGSDDARRKMHEPRQFEIMQLDAHMGVLTAVMELLVQSRDDGIHVVPRVPWRWREFCFDGIHAAGAFVIGATIAEGRTSSIRILSRAGKPLRLRHGLGDRWTLDGQPRTGDSLDTPTRLGQTLVLARV